jgi:predicted transcriptional regulator
MPEEAPSASINRELAAKIAAAYVRQNQIGSDQLGELISTVHQAISGAWQTRSRSRRRANAKKLIGHDDIGSLTMTEAGADSLLIYDFTAMWPIC